MTKRSYEQYCGLAAALDVVAERWALLVVRDLAPGPRRFSDLFAGLPGIATDMLAERLRSLAAAGVIETRELRHPVRAKVYDLTDRGRELAAIASHLASWGMELLPDPISPGHRKNPRWALQSMARAYVGGAPETVVHLSIDDDELTLTIVAESATVRYGHIGAPDLALRTTAEGFFAMVLTAGRSLDLVEIASGRRSDLRRILRALPLRTPLATASSVESRAARQR